MANLLTICTCYNVNSGMGLNGKTKIENLKTFFYDQRL